MNKLLKQIMLCCFCVALLTGCSTTGDQAQDEPRSLQERLTKDQPEEETLSERETVEMLYNKASAALDDDKYTDAAKLFDEVEQEYPYSSWATRAQIMAGYAHYRNMSYDEAILALDRFIQLHPSDDNIAYAYYLRALCYYEQISDVRRDQKMTELALDNLSQVANRYPKSKYARDATLKIDLTLDHLAGKEMEIGRYYLIRGHHHAAIARFQEVIDEYQTTTHVPEALHRLVEAYLALGIRPEAEKMASVLGYNYPDSQWYADSYTLLTGQEMTTAEQKEKKNFFEKALDSIIQ